jgi:hypothetical protein
MVGTTRRSSFELGSGGEGLSPDGWPSAGRRGPSRTSSRRCSGSIPAAFRREAGAAAVRKGWGVLPARMREDEWTQVPARRGDLAPVLLGSSSGRGQEPLYPSRESGAHWGRADAGQARGPDGPEDARGHRVLRPDIRGGPSDRAQVAWCPNKEETR